MSATNHRIDRGALESFCASVFQSQGLSPADAEVAARVLVGADALGIPSHGLGRLGRYVQGLKTGLMLPDARVEVLSDTPSSLLLDAHGAMGAPVSERAMREVIEKARISGAAFASVRDSNHFGIAGHYARMALKEDMLGIAMTNTAALGVPTFGAAVMYGTNPIAFAAPASRETAFVLDMSTTVVSRGKIEVHERLGKGIPVGWAVDKRGADTTAPGPLLRDMQDRAGGGILPLGGRGKDFGGHKGYGLAVMVDILCAVLGGAAFGAQIRDSETSSARVSHFFGAIRVASFRDPEDFKRDMDEMLRGLRESPVAEGEEEVLYAGLPETEKELESARLGVPLLAKTYEELLRIGKDCGVEAPRPIG